MGFHQAARPRQRRPGLAALACAALALTAAPALAQSNITTQATLLDRIQIEDFLISYYQPLGSGGGEDLAQYFTEDGTIDVNGRVYQGRAGVRQAYKDAGAARGPSFKGRFHMRMNNPRIVVTGDTATADLIWTGISSTALAAEPHLVEQGREHDDLIKKDGRWWIRKRVITSDGGLAPFYAQTRGDR
jgi:hypothetical protein